MQNIKPEIFSQVSNLSDDVYFVYDLEKSRFEYLSPAFENMWEISPDEVLNNPAIFLDTIDPVDLSYVKDCYRKVIQSNQEVKFDFKIICVKGTRKFILAKVFPILEDGVIKQLAGIAEDVSVTQRNIFYGEKINARKNSMLEILAHDLKGPIGMISMMASSMERDINKANHEHLLNSIEFIQRLCKRNIALIRNTVNQEFLESPQVDLRKERADIAWGIKDVIENYKRSENNISKNFKITTSTERLYIQMDTLKVMQVFNNLISNAIKFTPDNGIIELDIQEQETTVQITVSDNGIGIPADLQPYLFEKFTRARRIGLRGEEPVGLGMSIIKTIIELHNGKIWFESKENAGTKFYIQLPKQ